MTPLPHDGDPRLRLADREQVEFRACSWNDLLPDEMLVDGGYTKKADIVAVAPPHGSTTVDAPVQVSKTSKRDAHEHRPDDKPAVAERVDAIACNRGLQQFRVRGRPMVRVVILCYVRPRPQPDTNGRPAREGRGSGLIGNVKGQAARTGTTSDQAIEPRQPVKGIRRSASRKNRPTAIS